MNCPEFRSDASLLLLQAEFPCVWTPSLSSSLLGPVVPILRVVPSQGFALLSPRQIRSPGNTAPDSALEALSPDLGQPQEYKWSPVASLPGCSRGPWPAGRPFGPEPATGLWLEFPWPLPSPLCTQRLASAFLSGPGLSELSSGFIFGRSCILSLLIYSLPAGKVWDPWARLGIGL